MSDRPSHLWKSMPVEKRTVAAEAFWRDGDTAELRAQQAEAIVLLARRLNFRPRSIQALPIERRARQLAQVAELGEGLATRALVAYHFSSQRPLMAAFLDALGITHDNGVITDEHVSPPDRDRVQSAVRSLRGTFDSNDIDLYLRTLVALDGDTWANIEPLPEH